MKVLLVEPSYKNKYPPLGLMKISSFHKDRGDEITFVKGCINEIKNELWDRIYITTLFTFYWRKTLSTIEYYKNSVKNESDVFVGGVLATIQANRLRHEFPNVTVIEGLLNREGLIGLEGEANIDTMTPDYSILEETGYFDYNYQAGESYISYATRGCVRKCKFCVVHEIEPEYTDYISIKKTVESIKKNYGEKRNLLLMDNNILASKSFNKIIDEIKSLGYSRNNKSYKSPKSGKLLTRYVDFNQGVDARLLTEEKAKKLSELEIKPLRIAFDHADDNYVKLYTEKIKLSASLGMKNLSNYVLFNLDDTPEDLYKRLLINVNLNEEFSKDPELKGTQIFSFPMRYSPIKGEESHGRKFIGKHWSWKYIRTIQCILNATHGVVGPKKDYFYRSFGDTIEEFRYLLVMPEEYIINRVKHEKNGMRKCWQNQYDSLNSKYGKQYILNLISDAYIDKKTYDLQVKDIQVFLKHYKIKNGRMVERSEKYNYQYPDE